MIKKIIKKVFTVFSVFAPFFSKKSNLDSETAKKLLADYSPKPEGQPLCTNVISPPLYDLQIIIPAYNVEKYLEGCLESIFSQETKYTYKVVLIDDGSTDKTGEIADKYLNNEKLMVIHQPNKGFSGARNTGLKEIFSKYIMFVDSDDMLCPGAIESIMNTAFEHDSDIVEGGALYLKGEKTGVYFSYPQKKEIPTALGVLHGQPWAKVFKADCFKNLVYPEGYWFEDTIFSFLVYPIKKQVCVLDHFIYVYRINDKGISATQQGKSKSIDTYWITEMLMDTRYNMFLAFDESFFKKYLHQIMLNQKRIARLPEHIQESVFILTADLMNRYFPAELIENNKHLKLVHALITKDWEMYKFYCKYHS